jgi:hypothetical protein
MAQLTLQIAAGYGGAGSLAGTSDVLPYWISVTNDQGKAATGLSNNFAVKTLQTPPGPAEEVEFGWDWAPENWPGFYEANILPKDGKTWRKGTYMLGIIVGKPTFGSLYPPKILGSDNGQALLRIIVN